ncbi:phage baseplate assembly protein V, partial [Alteraurantiacibacter buctensis]
MSAAAEDIPARVGELIRVGTVSELDLETARCRVLYGDPDDEDGGATTGWIRWLTLRSGETRTWSPPSVGEQVLLIVPDGQIGSAVALPGLVRDMFPALGTSTTEIIEFADGARLSYDPEGHELVAELPAGATATITAPGGLTIDAAGGITL